MREAFRAEERRFCERNWNREAFNNNCHDSDKNQ